MMPSMMIHNAFHPGETSCLKLTVIFAGNPSVQDHGDNNMSDEWNLTFPGPLLCSEMEKEDLMAFIQRTSQEILQRVDDPEQKKAHFFWQIMALLCNCNALACLTTKDDRCLPVTDLLCSAATDDELRQTVIKMAEDLVCRGQIFASHICCMVTQQELGCHSDSSFYINGCDSLPMQKPVIREAIGQSEVHEYVLFINSGITQLKFQKCKLFLEGLSALALDNSEVIATADATSPSSIHMTMMKPIVLANGENVWLLNLHQTSADRVPERVFQSNQDDMFTGLPPFTTPEEEFASRYIEGELLGYGGFGCVYAGVRKADGKMVAIKNVNKSTYKKFITVAGNIDTLPLEVALMQMVSMPPRCDYVVELLEWFEMSSSFVLVMEQPSPCMDLYEFCKHYNGRLPEPLARDIMWQVVQAAGHCSERGVLHRDIKQQNLLINPKTLQVKLIDFGCGDLLKDSPYTRYAGTPAFWPPEWNKKRRCRGRPATVWSLGALLFILLSGVYPFNYETVHEEVLQHSSLSKRCRHLILFCLKEKPSRRATLEDIINHDWFTECRHRQHCVDHFRT